MPGMRHDDSQLTMGANLHGALRCSLPNRATGSPHRSRLSIPQLLSRRPQAHILLISNEEVRAILQHGDQLLGTWQIIQLDRRTDSLLVFTNVDSNWNIVAISTTGISALNEDLTLARARGHGRGVNSNAVMSVATALLSFFAWREVWAFFRTLQKLVCVSASLLKWSPGRPTRLYDLGLGFGSHLSWSASLSVTGASHP